MIAKNPNLNLEIFWLSGRLQLFDRRSFVALFVRLCVAENVRYPHMYMFPLEK